MRLLEPFDVAHVAVHEDNVSVISTDGCMFARATRTFTRIPQVGEHLYLETVNGSRVTGLTDGNSFLFRYTDEQLAEQDAAMHDTE